MSSMAEYPMRLKVDGATFEVCRRPDNSFTYTWLDGPNGGGSGFATNATQRSVTVEEHIDSARNYLSIIDPETGYIPDDDE